MPLMSLSDTDEERRWVNRNYPNLKYKEKKIVKKIQNPGIQELGGNIIWSNTNAQICLDLQWDYVLTNLL